MAKRYKGRYVAQVEIDIDVNASAPGVLPFDEVRKNIYEQFTPALKEIIGGELLDGHGTVTVTQQYVDLYEVNEDG